LLNASSLALTIALTSGAAEPAATRVFVPVAEETPTIALNESLPPLPPVDFKGEAKLPAWLSEGPSSRPASLPAMYATLGVLQVLDVYSTRRSLKNGGTELNPAMKGNSGAMLAVKALSTAGSIFFAERAWKKNRKGAVILMAVVNGVTAAVVANNMKAAR
jgi:Domain of unknown function (DUF5658)